MPISSAVRPTHPPTVWLARGRHTGPDPLDVVRRNLQRLKDAGTIDDFLEPSEVEDASKPGFEARWRVPEGVTVRAGLTVLPMADTEADPGSEWVLAAEAERPWDQRWPSPATVFWPEAPDADWDHDIPTGLRLRDVNRLPEDDKAMRRLFRDAVRGSWNSRRMALSSSGRRLTSRRRSPVGMSWSQSASGASGQNTVAGRATAGAPPPPPAPAPDPGSAWGRRGRGPSSRTSSPSGTRRRANPGFRGRCSGSRRWCPRAVPQIAADKARSCVAAWAGQPSGGIMSTER
ncbi:hypothetical protein SALBM311S_04780 [Streptomyces alboniger]